MDEDSRISDSITAIPTFGQRVLAGPGSHPMKGLFFVDHLLVEYRLMNGESYSESAVQADNGSARSVDVQRYRNVTNSGKVLPTGKRCTKVWKNWKPALTVWMSMGRMVRSALYLISREAAR